MHWQSFTTGLTVGLVIAIIALLAVAIGQHKMKGAE